MIFNDLLLLTKENEYIILLKMPWGFCGHCPNSSDVGFRWEPRFCLLNYSLTGGSRLRIFKEGKDIQWVLLKSLRGTLIHLKAPNEMVGETSDRFSPENWLHKNSIFFLNNDFFLYHFVVNDRKSVFNVQSLRTILCLLIYKQIINQ